jgi:aryl-alcohol dehydrogenase-like predicted oxidoreductase
MDYVRLGRSGLRVSRLCLGTMNFGGITEESDSHAIMERALESGINFFDTADGYGGKYPGLTEEIIGRWFAKGHQRRDKVVLATKVFATMSDWPNESRLSARHIVSACDASLRRLQTDHIDLFQMHHVDRDTPWDEIWQAMETLVAQGKVVYVGSSNFAGWHIAQANEAAVRRHFLGIVSEQSVYNLLVRNVELEVLPACRHYGVGLIPYSPVSAGVLSGVLGHQDGARRRSDYVKPRIEAHRTKLEEWEQFCSELGEDPSAVALSWLLHQEGVTAPIIGPRTMGQLTEAPFRALELDLDADLLGRLDEIFPGPGGAAPEAYAW